MCEYAQDWSRGRDGTMRRCRGGRASKTRCRRGRSRLEASALELAVGIFGTHSVLVARSAAYQSIAATINLATIKERLVI
jgi:hypothetical protein